MGSVAQAGEGSSVLRGLSGQLVCSHLTNNELRSLSESTRDLRNLASVSVKELAPKCARSQLTSRFAFLQSLDLSQLQNAGQPGDHISLKDAAAFRHLQHLCLQKFSGLTDAGLADLADCLSLASLDLRGCSKVTWAGLQCLHPLTNLRQLNCSGVKYTGHGASDTPSLHAVLSRLESLTMGDACTLSWVDDSLMALVGEHARALAHLDCGGCIDMTDAGVASIQGLARLRRLSLQSCVRLSNACVGSIAHLTCLESLNLRGCLQITQQGLAQLSTVSGLRELVLSCCQGVSRLDRQLLSSFRQLRSLNLANCTHLDSVAEVAALAGSLSHLSIARCGKLQLEGLRPLSALTALEALDMSDMRNQAVVAPGTADELRQLSALRSLRVLTMNKFHRPGGLPRSLLSAIAHMTSLRELSMAGCSPEEEDGEEEEKDGGDGREPHVRATAGATAPKSHLWFVEGLLRLEKLDVSGWRHAHAGSLKSLSKLVHLTSLRLQRFANDTDCGSASTDSCSSGSGSDSEASTCDDRHACEPVHLALMQIRCPRPDPAHDSLCTPGNSGGATALYPPSSSLDLHKQACLFAADSDSTSASPHSCGVCPACAGLTEMGSLENMMAAVDITMSQGSATSDAHATAKGASSADASSECATQCYCGVDTAATPCSASQLERCAADGMPLPPHSRRSNRPASQAFAGALEHLSGLQRLQELDMEACKGLVDAGVQHIARLCALETLNVTGCSKLTGATLWLLAPDVRTGLGGCPHLRRVCLDDCPDISSDALAGLAGLPRLHTLSLRGCTRVGDRGMEALAARASRLAELMLYSASALTSRGVRSLARLPNLRSLHLPHCWQVGDDGVVELARCRSLGYLSVQHCWRVSPGALRTLQQRNAALTIVAPH